MTKFNQNFLSLLRVRVSIFRLISLYSTDPYLLSFDSIHSHCHEDGIILYSILKEFWVSRTSATHSEKVSLSGTLPLDDVDTSNNNNAKVGVSEAVDNEEGSVGNDNGGTIPKELDLDLGPYWALAQSAQAYVLNTIASYSNIEASKLTPQYGFNRGLKEFGTLGYEATVKELDGEFRLIPTFS
jgi:hypothetical protein